MTNPGDTYLQFNGVDAYVEIPSSDEFSIATSGELTVSAWLRPDVLNFENFEGSGYVHWMGKGEAGQNEWVFRMYNRDGTRETPPRPNRVSFYVFNPEGGLGVGSFVQEPVSKGDWLHVVGVAGTAQTFLYKNGLYKRCDTYRGAATAACPAHRQAGSDKQLVIEPRTGTSPVRIGTRDFGSFFQGGIRRVRFWNRVLDKAEIHSLFKSDDAPADGLVAEYLLDADTGSEAVDSAGGKSGEIYGAVWVQQEANASNRG